MAKPKHWFSYLINALAGGLLTLAYAPFDLSWLAFLSFTVLFISIIKASRRVAINIVVCFSLAWFGAGLAWVHVSIAQFGGLPLLASLSLIALLCSYLALFPITGIALLLRFEQRYWIGLLPLIWLSIEYLRSVLFTGFPWLSIGYTQVDGMLSPWLPVIGEFGVSALLVTSSLAMTFCCYRKLLRVSVGYLIAIGVTTALLSQKTWVTQSEQSASISIVQGNIAQALRWVPAQDTPTMEHYLKLTAPLWDSHDIILWPEAAIPRIEALAQDYVSALDKRAYQTNTGLITGLLDYDFTYQRAYNNVISLGKRTASQETADYHYQDAYRFSKHHLLPIGEFVPFEALLRKLAPIFDLPMSSFTRGAYVQPNLVANGWSFLPAICFEIAFPRQIRANMTAQTQAILTVSNDAWFGNSHGPHQHLQLARARALEFGLPVIRGTNNGITAFISPNGDIESALPQFQSAVLSHKIYAYTGQTPYARYGESLAWLIVIMFTLVTLVTSQQLKK